MTGLSGHVSIERRNFIHSHLEGTSFWALH